MTVAAAKLAQVASHLVRSGHTRGIGPKRQRIEFCPTRHFPFHFGIVKYHCRFVSTRLFNTTSPGLSSPTHVAHIAHVPRRGATAPTTYDKRTLASCISWLFSVVFDICKPLPPNVAGVVLYLFHPAANTALNQSDGAVPKAPATANTRPRSSDRVSTHTASCSSSV